MLTDRERLRKSQTRIRTVALSATSAQLIAGDANRISLRFFSTPTARWTATPGKTASDLNGWTMHPGQVSELVEMSYGEDALVGEWSGVAPGGALTVCVVETVLLD